MGQQTMESCLDAADASQMSQSYVLPILKFWGQWLVQLSIQVYCHFVHAIANMLQLSMYHLPQRSVVSVIAPMLDCLP